MIDRLTEDLKEEMTRLGYVGKPGNTSGPQVNVTVITTPLEVARPTAPSATVPPPKRLLPTDGEFQFGTIPNTATQELLGNQYIPYLRTVFAEHTPDGPIYHKTKPNPQPNWQWVPKKRTLPKTEDEWVAARKAFDASLGQAPQATYTPPKTRHVRTVAPGLKSILYKDWPAHYRDSVIMARLLTPESSQEDIHLFSKAHRHNSWLKFHLAEVRARNNRKEARRSDLNARRALRAKRAELQKFPMNDGFLPVLTQKGEWPLETKRACSGRTFGLPTWNLFQSLCYRTEDCPDISYTGTFSMYHGPAKTARRKFTIIDEGCVKTRTYTPPITPERREMLSRRLQIILLRMSIERLFRHCKGGPIRQFYDNDSDTLSQGTTNSDITMADDTAWFSQEQNQYPAATGASHNQKFNNHTPDFDQDEIITPGYKSCGVHGDELALSKDERSFEELDAYFDYIYRATYGYPNVDPACLLAWLCHTDEFGNTFAGIHTCDNLMVFGEDTPMYFTQLSYALESIRSMAPITVVQDMPQANAPRWDPATLNVRITDDSRLSRDTPKDQWEQGNPRSIDTNRAINTYLYGVANNAILKDIHESIMSGSSNSGGSMSNTDFSSINRKLDTIINQTAGGTSSSGSGNVPSTFDGAFVEKTQNSLRNMELMLRTLHERRTDRITYNRPNFADANGWTQHEKVANLRRDRNATFAPLNNTTFNGVEMVSYAAMHYPGQDERIAGAGFNMQALGKLIGLEFRDDELVHVINGKHYGTHQLYNMQRTLANHLISKGWVTSDHNSIVPPVNPPLSSALNQTMKQMLAILTAMAERQGITVPHANANMETSLCIKSYDEIYMDLLKSSLEFYDVDTSAYANTGGRTDLNEDDSMPVGDTQTISRTGEVVHQTDGVVIEVPVKGFISDFQLNDVYNVNALIGRRMRVKQKLMTVMNRGDHIFALHLPNDLYAESATNPYFNDITRHFMSMKMDFKVRVTTNAPLTYGGVMMLHWDWFGRTADSYELTPEIVSTGNYVRWDLSKQEYVEMAVPGAAISHWISRSFERTAPWYLGRFDLIAASNILIPEGCAYPTFTMYCAVVNANVHTLVPKWNTVPAVPNANTITTKNVSAYSYTSLPGMSVPFPMNLTQNPSPPSSGGETINEYIGQWSLVRSCMWKSTQPAREILTTWVSTPTAANFIGDKIQPTAISEYARHFQYWSGGLEYQVEICSSNFTSGKIMVTADPGTTVSSSNTSAKMHHIVDLRQQHTFDFSCPYNAPTPYRPTFFVGTRGDDIYSRNYTLNMYVEEPLITGIEGTPEVTINVYVRPMQDFCFAVAGNGLGHYNALALAVVQGYPDESMATVTHNGRRFMDNEPWMDQYQVLQRYMDFTSFYLKRNYKKDIYIPVMPRFPEGIENNVLANVAKHYSYWNGSLRYKFKVTDGRGTIAIGHAANTGIVQHIKNKPFGKQEHRQGLKGGFSWGSYQKFDVNVEDTFEIEVPYYSMYEYLHIPLRFYKNSILPIGSCNCGNLVIQPIAVEIQMEFEVSISIGADFRFYGRSNAGPKKARRADETLRLVRYAFPVNDTDVVAQVDDDRLVEDDSSPAEARPQNENERPMAQANGYKEDEAEFWGEPNCLTDQKAEEYKGIIALRKRGHGKVRLSLWHEFHILIQKWKDERKNKPQANGISEWLSARLCTTVTSDKSALKDMIHEVTQTFFECMCTCIRTSVYNVYKKVFGDFTDFFDKIVDSISWDNVCEVIGYIIIREIMKRLGFKEMFDYLLLPLIIAKKLSPQLQRIFDQALDNMKIMKQGQIKEKTKSQTERLEAAIFQQEHFIDIDDISAEANGIMDSINFIVPILAVITAASSINPDASILKQAGKFIQNLGKTRDMEKGSGYIRETVEKLKRKFLPSIDNDLEEVTKENAVNIITWLEEFNLEQMKFQLKGNPERHVVIAQAKRQSKLLTELVKRKELDNCWMNRIVRVNERIAKYENYFYKQNNITRFRKDPFHVSIFGEPGVGKSTIMGEVEHFLMKVFDIKPYQSYSRTRTDHWDGFSPEMKFLKMDDLAQHSGMEAADIMELILMKSNNPFIVPMADLEEKGMSFKADFILSTTNCPYLHSDLRMLRNEQAFHRRRDMLVEMDFIDPLIPPSANKNFFNSKFRLFNPQSRFGGVEHPGWHTWEEFKVLLVEYAQKHHRNQDRLLERSQEFDNELLAMPNNADYKILGAAIGDEIYHGDVLKRFLKSADQMYLNEVGELQKKGHLKWMHSMEKISIEAVTAENLKEIDEEISSAPDGPIKEALNSLKRRVVSTQAVNTAAGLTIQATDMVYGTATCVSETIKSYGDKAGEFGVEFCSGVREQLKPASNLLIHAYEKFKRGLIIAGQYLQTAFDKFVKFCSLTPMKYFLMATSIAAVISFGAFKLYRKMSGIANKVLANTADLEDYDDRMLKKKAEKKAFEDMAEDYDRWYHTKGPSGHTRYELWDLQQELSGSEMGSMLGRNAKAAHDFYEMDIDNAYRGQMKFRSRPYANAQQENFKNKVIANGVEIPTLGNQNIRCDTMPNFIGDNMLSNQVYLVIDTNTKFAQRGFMINDHMLMTTFHFWLKGDGKLRTDIEWPVYLNIYFHDRPQPETVMIQKPQICGQADIDTCFIHLDRHIIGVKDVAKYFPRSSDLLEHNTANILGIRYVKGKMHFLIEGIPQMRLLNTPLRYEMGVLILTCKGVYYDSILHYGDCGSIIVCADQLNRPRIIGMHVAGDPTKGKGRRYASLIKREHIIKAYNFFCLPVPQANGGVDVTIEHLKEINAFKDIPKGQTKGFPSGFSEFLKPAAVIGLCAAAYHGASFMKSKITPSVIADDMAKLGIESGRAPAILDDRDPRNKLRIEPSCVAVNKYLTEPCSIQKEDIKLVASHLSAKMLPLEGDLPRRVLDINRALNGYDKTNFDKIDRDTSPGEPWVAKFHGKGKHNIITEYPYEWKQEDVKFATLQRIACYRNGISYPTTTVTFPKDELKSHKKVKEVNTRTIECLPMDLTLATRMYFGAWISMLYRNNAKLSCQGGLDPNSPLWGDQARRLLSKGNKFVAGDYKNFDGKPSAMMIDSIVWAINNWYDDGPSNARVRHMIVRESYERITIVNGFFVQLDHGIPSGFALTMSLNSCLNDLYKGCAWINIMPKELRSLDIMEQETDALTLGDDHVIALSDKVCEYFNVQTFGDYLGSVGVTYTDAHKNPYSSAQKYTGFEDVSFLKRTWRPHPQDKTLWMAPLDQSTIEERCLWVKDVKNFTQNKVRTIVNIELSLKEACPHGEAYFEKLRKTLMAAWSNAKLPPCEFPVVSYDVQMQNLSDLLRNGNTIVKITE